MAGRRTAIWAAASVVAAGLAYKIYRNRRRRGRVQIEPERPGDFLNINKLVATAFKDNPHSDGSEADLVGRLRSLPGHDPELFLVARDPSSNAVVGFVAFSQVSVLGSIAAVCLAPLAVSRDWRCSGIGAELVRAGLDTCKGKSIKAVFVQGKPQYYERFGFRLMVKHTPKLETQWKMHDYDMVLEPYGDNALSAASGIVSYPADAWGPAS